jgi:hypothetical protein
MLGLPHPGVAGESHRCHGLVVAAAGRISITRGRPVLPWQAAPLNAGFPPPLIGIRSSTRAQEAFRRTAVWVRNEAKGGPVVSLRVTHPYHLYLPPPPGYQYPPVHLALWCQATGGPPSLLRTDPIFT